MRLRALKNHENQIDYNLLIKKDFLFIKPLALYYTSGVMVKQIQGGFMKKTTVSMLSIALVAGMCVSSGAFAAHPNQGVIDVKVTNMSHSTLKVRGCHGHPAVHTFGPKTVMFTVKENTFAKHKVLGFQDTGSYVVKYHFDKHIAPASDWGSSVTVKKLAKAKDGHWFYKKCTFHVFGGAAKPAYAEMGSLCKHLDVKTSTGSGDISYVKITYDPMKK